MAKDVSQLTDKERANLFPVILKKHNPEWFKWYANEKEALLKSTGEIAAIYHYGSTSIPNIMAKPTVDILIEVEKTADLEKLKSSIINLGYNYMKYGKAPGILFVKGYTINGFAEKVFHIHVFYKEEYQPEILFRDYLISHPETAKEYEHLKISLMDKYKFDRDKYTNMKSEFVQKITAVAVSQYKAGL